ncbi:hypothetical protein DYI23_11660 [Roseibium polysiphoniae]|uniref:Uncharacterized protein n=1 Tax=Roseibium polysiphoniae TaxID=2571221 RepID=A0A944CD56_9HYPH|nr:hypothetical protein [Roseibium polysiphoniae]
MKDHISLKRPGNIVIEDRVVKNQLGIGNAMTYLTQILGTTLMGVVSGHSAAQLGQMNQTLRAGQARKGRK